MNLFSLLCRSNYSTYNRELAKTIGLHEAIFLSILTDKREHHHDELISIDDEDGYFYLKLEDAYDLTALSRKQQDLAIKSLEKLGLIKKKVKGSPPLRYFKLNDEAIMALFNVQKISTNLSERDKSICPKGTNQFVRKGQIGPYSIYEPKERTLSKNVPPPSEESGRLAAELFLAIKKIREELGVAPPKEPKLENWAKEIQAKIKRDKLDPCRFEAIIKWLPTDRFWKKNIRSAEKLCLQFETLELEMAVNQEKGFVSTNTQLVISTKQEYKDQLKNITIKGDFVCNAEKHTELSLKMKPDAFEPAFLHLVGAEWED